MALRALVWPRSLLHNASTSFEEQKQWISTPKSSRLGCIGSCLVTAQAQCGPRPRVHVLRCRPTDRAISPGPGPHATALHRRRGTFAMWTWQAQRPPSRRVFLSHDKQLCGLVENLADPFVAVLEPRVTASAAQPQQSRWKLHPRHVTASSLKGGGPWTCDPRSAAGNPTTTASPRPSSASTTRPTRIAATASEARTRSTLEGFRSAPSGSAS